MSASGIKAGHPSFGPPYRRRATFGHLPGRGRALAACHRSRVGECCNSEVTNCKPAEYECSTLAGVIGSWTLANYQFRQVAVDQLWIDHLSFAHSFLSQIVDDNSVESIHSLWMPRSSLVGNRREGPRLEPVRVKKRFEIEGDRHRTDN